MKYFEFKDNSSPITFSAPHGSNIYPNGDISKEQGDRGTKELTIKLSKLLNANYLISNISRTYVDFNREEKQCILKKFGIENYNETISNKEEEKRKSIHNNYFKVLKKLCTKYHFSIHSMHETGQKGSIDENTKRKQIVISDLDGISFEKEKLKKLIKGFEKEGYDISYNKPFKGGYEIKYTKNYCNSIQLEIRKDLLLSAEKNSNKQNLFIDIKKINSLSNKIAKILRIIND